MPNYGYSLLGFSLILYANQIFGWNLGQDALVALYIYTTLSSTGVNIFVDAKSIPLAIRFLFEKVKTNPIQALVYFVLSLPISVAAFNITYEAMIEAVSPTTFSFFKDFLFPEVINSKIAAGICGGYQAFKKFCISGARFCELSEFYSSSIKFQNHGV